MKTYNELTAILQLYKELEELNHHTGACELLVDHFGIGIEKDIITAMRSRTEKAGGSISDADYQIRNVISTKYYKMLLKMIDKCPVPPPPAAPPAPPIARVTKPVPRPTKGTKMTMKDVLSAMNESKVSKSQKDHAKTLADVYNMLAELSGHVTEVTIKEQDFNFGRENSYRWTSLGTEVTTLTEGIKTRGEKWTIKTQTGSYCVSLPIGNSLYQAFCNLFPQFIQQEKQVVESVTPDRVLTFNEEVTSEIKKAMPFITYDELRPNMSAVHVVIKSGRCEIMGTNGHKLYRSFHIPIDESDITLMLPINALKAAKVKDSLTVGLFYKDGQAIKGMVNGIEFKYPQADPLDYNDVIPTYQDYVEFNRKDLIQTIKAALPSANRVTHQIRMMFNGCIQVSAEDLDFSSENCVRIGYLEKTVKDFEIGVNGRLLLDCLNSVDGFTARIYSAGDNRRCILVDNKALLMPVMLNKYV